MLNLNDLYYFVQVVDRKGFAAAAQALGLPRSTLSHRIAQLEAHLGAQLIVRTSRSLAVTELGREVYRHAQGMRIEAEAAQQVVHRRLAEPSGTVRFTCSVGMARSLVEVILRFLAAFPKIHVVQQATNRYVDLVEEGFDIALRGHTSTLADSSLVQRPLLRAAWHLFAGPGYLERAGVPVVPLDLSEHVGLVLGSRVVEPTWRLRGADGAQTSIAFVPRLRCDDLLMLRAAAMQDLGIAALPEHLTRHELQAGTLCRVLPHWIAGDGTITLLMPAGRSQLPSVRAFVDFLVAEFPQAMT